MDREELDRAIRNWVRLNLSVSVSVYCRGDQVNVGVRLVDGEGLEITSARDSDSVVIYQSDVR